ncbi:histidine phosphatase family protein [Phytoactinopolyspora endophytica]|uniref:histidine phosphatase family protein n=1 Tax=Phytoactinopolyspora endophytica TaxID=1642495 RepID=UPI00197C6274|nr:histidine phosphatase family protein [Phytoactinopolyspora endophytica]
MPVVGVSGESVGSGAFDTGRLVISAIVVILVRHAMPEVDPAVPPHEWHLSAEGREATEALHLPVRARVVSSTEPKAAQTLEHCGVVVRDARFNEVRRSSEPFGGNWRALRRAYVDGVEHDGWEPHEAVAARFGSAIDEHRDNARGEVLVVAAHGMAITVWLARRLGLADPVQFWEGLRFPDMITLDHI